MTQKKSAPSFTVDPEMINSPTKANSFNAAGGFLDGEVGGVERISEKKVRKEGRRKRTRARYQHERIDGRQFALRTPGL